MTENFRVPPQDVEAEQSVLGAMMLSKDAAFMVSQTLKPEHFYRESHRHLYHAITKVFEEGKPVDIITLSNELKQRNEFDSVGGVSYLTTLIERTNTAANADYHATIVREKWLLRNLIRVAMKVTADAYEDSIPVQELLDEASNTILSVAEEATYNDLACEMSDLTLSVHTAILSAKQGTRTPHIESGFPDLDLKFGGWERGALTVIMAQPKVGKSHLMINSMDRIAQEKHAGKNDGVRVAYVILDMTRKTVMLRMLSRRLSKTIFEIQSPNVDMLPIADELHAIGKLPIKIAGEENVGRDLKRILRWMTYAKKFFGTEIFFIDSFSKIDIKPDKGQTDESFTAQMINSFQSAAKILDVAVVGTVDLNYEGQAKGSSRWGFGPDNVFKLVLSEDEKSLIMESKYLRNSPAGKVTFVPNYRWSEVRSYEKR